MKKIYTTLVLILLSFKPVFVQAQDITILDKFIILDATMNSEDITPHMLSSEAFLSLYEVKEEEAMYFSNVQPRNESMSYGVIYDAEMEEFAETDESFGGVQLSFYWKYYNTYDDKTGTASVRIQKIFKPQGIYFEAIIVPENLDLLVYKGYVDGTLDLAAFDQ